LQEQGAVPDPDRDRHWQRLAKRFGLPRYLAKYLNELTLTASPTTSISHPGGQAITLNSARKYEQLILQKMSVPTKAKAIQIATVELRRHDEERLSHRDALDVARAHLSRGDFVLAQERLRRLEAAEQEESLDIPTIAALHLCLSQLYGEQGLLKEARQHGWRAYELAEELHDEAGRISAYLQIAILFSRGYEDERALKLIQRAPSDSISDERCRTTRNALEATFTWWAGGQPEMRTVRSVLKSLEHDGDQNGVELALLTQGLDAVHGGEALAIPGVWMPSRRITHQEDQLRRELISWRRDVFPSASVYANLLDLLNETKESLVDRVEDTRLQSLIRRGRSLAQQVGAIRLDGVFQHYATSRVANSPAP
jgi:tetratricopeptide (TPR) repeat protein